MTASGMEFPMAQEKKCLQRCELYTDQDGSTVSVK